MPDTDASDSWRQSGEVREVLRQESMQPGVVPFGARELGACASAIAMVETDNMPRDLE